MFSKVVKFGANLRYKRAHGTLAAGQEFNLIGFGVHPVAYYSKETSHEGLVEFTCKLRYLWTPDFSLFGRGSDDLHNPCGVETMGLRCMGLSMASGGPGYIRLLRGEGA